MRLRDFIEHPLVHSAFAGIGVDQHHLRPANQQVSNTTLSIDPLPGGPGVWDITVPFDAQVVVFSLRSAHNCAEAGGMSGLIGIADRNSLHTTCADFGEHGTFGTTSYNAIYSKLSGAMNLSDKYFSSASDAIVLTDAYLIATGPVTRVLRTVWTNYGALVRTLAVWGQIGVLA